MSLWTVTQDRGVVTAIYRHGPMNYFCADGAAELGALIETWRAPEVKAVVLAGGTPGRFITHYSVEELLSYAEHRQDLEKAGPALNEGYHALLQSLSDLPKPVIAAMNGDAMGGGFELCLSCDIRIGQQGDFRYGLPEVKLGILPGGSGTQRLSRLIGWGRAVEFILRGRVVKPEQALQMGLIHEVAEDALEAAQRIAAEIAAIPAFAVASAKRSVYEGADVTLAKGLQLEAQRFFETMLTDEAVATMREYVAQPLERRRDWLEQNRATRP